MGPVRYQQKLTSWSSLLEDIVKKMKDLANLTLPLPRGGGGGGVSSITFE